MAEPQRVLEPLTAAAIFLVVTIDEGGEAAVRDLLTQHPALQKSVGFRNPDTELNLVIGIGSDAWDRLFTGTKPRELHKLPAYDGPKHTAPSTPGDLLFHIRGEDHGPCFELAKMIATSLRGYATVVEETAGFRYYDKRDLLGFVDGTANPIGDEAVQSVYICPELDPDFVGGSYVVTQKYTHPLEKWEALTIEEQERVIGRTKLSDYELPDSVKPPSSHIIMNTINDPDGVQRQIVRANMPFGTVGTAYFGTFYIAYCNTPSVIERMLERMFLGTADAPYDRILDFSVAQSGSLFFVPPIEFFGNLPAAPADVANESDPVVIPAFEPVIRANAAAEGSGPAAGSLGIGSMKGSQA
ncbi:Dyp-type peroxidase [Nocardia camponoti]|uniref:Peroxidase n=1 Tax=Nocardia camponoti TaxID=1616106 RepID=A0A917QH44_9NOCA|nr:Dyp-type peroxidase [Nocardia camponoti]GGK49603.1 peroxidase [Nocardia camponoti]